MAATATVGLSEAASPGLVFPDLRGSDREGVLSELADGFAAGVEEGIDSAIVRRGLAERERLGTTALGDGLAVPHCKLEGLRRTRLAIGVHRAGVDFGAPDGGPTRLFMAVLSPASAPGAHLMLLAAIARWARVPGRVEAMVAANDASAMLGLLAPDSTPGAGER